MTVIYICDKKKDCADPNKFIPCYPCQHTTDPEHALNGVCEDPWNYPERFELIGLSQYWERDNYGTVG